MNLEPSFSILGDVPPLLAKAFFGLKRAFTLGPLELQYLRDENQGFNLIDVRAARDFKKGHAPQAVNLPEERWTRGAEALSKDIMSVFCGYSGLCPLAARAAVHFAEMGYPVMEMEGGFEAWQDHLLEVVSENDPRAA